MTRRLPPLSSTFRPGARSAIWRCRSRSNWLDGCARRRRSSRRTLSDSSGAWTALRGSTPPGAGKAIVEHTAINPNKAAHIGHLRNAALGDAFGRLLRYRGRVVEIQNYIDDTGVQVADVAVGFRELEGKDLAGVRAIADTTRFDYYCWDLYARVTEWYEADKDRLRIRSAALHDIEHGGNETAAVAQLIADRIVRRHLETMARLNIGYDLLTWEGDILRLHFWTHAFEFLKRTGAVFLQTEGKLKGCWVMRIEDEAAAPAEAEQEGEGEEEEEEEQREKVIVRSDGTVTYVGKDMAYQLWKFGLLGRDFHYRPFASEKDRVLWSTTVSIGCRVFARIISISVWLTLPSSRILRIGL